MEEEADTEEPFPPLGVPQAAPGLALMTLETPTPSSRGAGAPLWRTLSPGPFLTHPIDWTQDQMSMVPIMTSHLSSLPAKGLSYIFKLETLRKVMK